MESCSEVGLTKVLGLLRAALTMLDEIGAPADVGAHLAMVISRVEECASGADPGKEPPAHRDGRH